MSNTSCTNHEEAHEFYTIREFEDIIMEKGADYVISKMERDSVGRIVGYLKFKEEVDKSKEVSALCKKC